MRAGLAIFKNSVKTMFAYRFNFIAWAVMAPVRIVLFVFLWGAVFSAYPAEKIGFYTFDSMVTYYVVMTICSGAIHSGVERIVEGDVRRGYLIQKIVKPVPYLHQLMSWEAGSKAMKLVVETVPIMVLAYILVGVAPAGLANLFLFILSLSMGAAINFFIMFNIGLIAFWTKKIHGVRRTYWAVRNVLSGWVVPLDLFPDLLTFLATFMPFQHLGFIQVGIFTNRYGTVASLTHLGVQVIWIALLYMVSGGVWTMAKDQFAGVGV